MTHTIPLHPAVFSHPLWRASALVLAAVVIAATGAAPAFAEVYRWTDDDGQVHFTDSPPPEASANAQRADGKSTDASTLMTATWYTKSQNALYKLIFEDDEFRLINRSASLEHETEIAIRGSWSLVEGTLALDFNSHPVRLQHQHASDKWYFTDKADRKPEYEITHLSTTRMKLDADTDHMQNWLSDYTPNLSGDTMEKLTGRWLKKGEALFSKQSPDGSWMDAMELGEDGRLETKDWLNARNTKRIRAQGSWHYQKPYLTLITVEARRIEGVDVEGINLRRSAERVRWKVLDLESDRIRLKHTQTGRIYVFESS